ncbi:MAG: hypothetical protein LUI14_02735 [Lachnospiraceae bacterium]|nr:hypothetical protein [Lachnospiraceae bacterium]MCD7765638.1 hypothetical protein [Lachnospiraceae bacterium]
MRKMQVARTKTPDVRTAFLFLFMALAFVLVCPGRAGLMRAQAEEAGYSDGTGETLWQDVYSGDTGSSDTFAADQAGFGASDAGMAAEEYETETEMLPGTYTMEEGWTENELLSSDGVTVYVQDAYADAESPETSLISCSFLDTNYSRQDYEQLRDMLTNKILYSNVSAQITTSAVYTLAMDYLYIILVDDSSAEYRTIYHYVVGDYQCFCVEVKEYRAEAEQAEAQEADTPQEIGQKIAEGFVWNE